MSELQLSDEEAKQIVLKHMLGDKINITQIQEDYAYASPYNNKFFIAIVPLVIGIVMTSVGFTISEPVVEAFGIIFIVIGVLLFIWWESNKTLFQRYKHIICTLNQESAPKVVFYTQEMGNKARLEFIKDFTPGNPENVTGDYILHNGKIMKSHDGGK